MQFLTRLTLDLVTGGKQASESETWSLKSGDIWGYAVCVEAIDANLERWTVSEGD